MTEEQRERQRDYHRRYREKNRLKMRSYYNKWRSKNGSAEKVRDRTLRRERGISLATKAEMIMRQDGRCALCEKGFATISVAHVDHDHGTGRIRDILCSMCNRGLGFFGDSADMLDRAAAYLRRHAMKAEAA